MKTGIKTLLKYFIFYFLLIVYLEVILRLVIGGISKTNFFFLYFIPSVAMFFASLSGFFRKAAGKIITGLLIFVLEIYYIAQCIYYNNFGSLFSVSMMKMGTDALGNFAWTLKDTIIDSLIYLALMLLPFILYIVFSSLKKIKADRYHLLLHLCSLALVVLLWFGGVFCIKLYGSERQAPYTVFRNSLAGTDTTASKFGALTTSVLEAGTYFFGFNSDTVVSPEAEITTVDISEFDNLSAISDPVASDPLLQDTSEDEKSSEESSTPTETVYASQINEAFDFDFLAANTADAELKDLYNYFSTRKGTLKNEYTGLFEGYNLIYICAEAFCSYACNEAVTPTLYKMANNGIVLNNFYNSFKNTTSNGEYAFCTSLWPDFSRVVDCGADSGSFPQSSTRYMPMGLGKLFSAVSGNTSYGFHNYYGSYYKRSSSLPNLGYTCSFMGKGMKFTTNWPASDLEMMEQSVDKYIGDEQFHAYYMTFSGHGPYNDTNCIYQKNIAAVEAALGKSKLGAKPRGYLAGAYELDKAMEYLLNRLEEAGKLDNTVIVIIGDHMPYNLKDSHMDQFAGHKMENNFERYESTCIIYNAGLLEPIVTDTVCCNVDILPTILNLFNIPYDSRLMMGTDIFATGVHKATLYNGNFITQYVKYNNETGEATWSESAASIPPGVRESYLNSLISTVDLEMSYSIKVLKNNFFKSLWYESGLMTDEELAEEEKRAKKISIEDVYGD